MVAAGRIAGIMELASEDVERRQAELLSAAGLPTGLEGIEPPRIIEAILLDKKTVGGQARFVIPLAIGRVVVKDNVLTEVVEQALNEIGDR
jgi:3-dehydroquinate synthase